MVKNRNKRVAYFLLAAGALTLAVVVLGAKHCKKQKKSSATKRKIDELLHEADMLIKKARK